MTGKSILAGAKHRMRKESKEVTDSLLDGLLIPAESMYVAVTFGKAKLLVYRATDLPKQVAG